LVLLCFKPVILDTVLALKVPAFAKKFYNSFSCQAARGIIHMQLSYTYVLYYNEITGDAGNRNLCNVARHTVSYYVVNYLVVDYYYYFPK